MMSNRTDKEVVRIRAKLFDGMMQPVDKKLCIDPQITSFDILHSLLSKAFSITDRPFAIFYMCRTGSEKDAYVSLLTDWDLDAAIMDSSCPFLKLKVDLRPFDEDKGILTDWDMVQSDEAAAQASRLPVVQSTLFDAFSKTVSSVGKAIVNIGKIQDGTMLYSEPLTPLVPPLSDSEFHKFLNPVGHLVEPAQFRSAVYDSGVEPSLRRVVWRHLLNVYPAELNGRERFDYFKQKCTEYTQVRERWRSRARLTESRPSVVSMINQDSRTTQQKLLERSAKSLAGAAGVRLNEEAGGEGMGGLWTPENLASVTSAVKKDVLRTDRRHPYFSGDDDSRNVVALFNVLVTYALTHPTISYCQGMSDLAAPLLVVEDDEAAAYVCFVALMGRLRHQFTVEGVGMTTKLKHLALLVEYHDPAFFMHLKENYSDDLLFTYRWLLLETKREFPLEDAMYALEVMWATLPHNPPSRDKGLCLTDEGYMNFDTKNIVPNRGGASYVCMKTNRRRISSDSNQSRPDSAARGVAGRVGEKKETIENAAACKENDSVCERNKDSERIQMPDSVCSVVDGKKNENNDTSKLSHDSSVSGKEISGSVVPQHKGSELVENVAKSELVSQEHCTKELGLELGSNDAKSELGSEVKIGDSKLVAKSIETASEISSSSEKTLPAMENQLNFTGDSNNKVTVSRTSSVKGQLGLDTKSLRPPSTSAISPSDMLSPGDEINPLEFLVLKTEEMEELERKSVSIDSSMTEDGTSPEVMPPGMGLPGILETERLSPRFGQRTSSPKSAPQAENEDCEISEKGEGLRQSNQLNENLEILANDANISATDAMNLNALVPVKEEREKTKIGVELCGDVVEEKVMEKQENVKVSQMSFDELYSLACGILDDSTNLSLRNATTLLLENTATTVPLENAENDLKMEHISTDLPLENTTTNLPLENITKTLPLEITAKNLMENATTNLPLENTITNLALENTDTVAKRDDDDTIEWGDFGKVEPADSNSFNLFDVNVVANHFGEVSSLCSNSNCTSDGCTASKCNKGEGCSSNKSAANDWAGISSKSNLNIEIDNSVKQNTRSKNENIASKFGEVSSNTDDDIISKIDMELNGSNSNSTSKHRLDSSITNDNNAASSNNNVNLRVNSLPNSTRSAPVSCSSPVTGPASNESSLRAEKSSYFTSSSLKRSSSITNTRQVEGHVLDLGFGAHVVYIDRDDDEELLRVDHRKNDSAKKVNHENTNKVNNESTRKMSAGNQESQASTKFVPKPSRHSASSNASRSEGTMVKSQTTGSLAESMRSFAASASSRLFRAVDIPGKAVPTIPPPAGIRPKNPALPAQSAARPKNSAILAQKSIAAPASKNAAAPAPKSTVTAPSVSKRNPIPGNAVPVTFNAFSINGERNPVPVSSSLLTDDVFDENSKASLKTEILKPLQLTECRKLSAHRDSVDSSDETNESTSLLKSSTEVKPDPSTDAIIDFVQVSQPPRLPPPEEFGEGNPFLMFLCLAMLLQHRNYVISQNFDCNELAQFYTRQTRKQNARVIVDRARAMYNDYKKKCIENATVAEENA